MTPKQIAKTVLKHDWGYFKETPEVNDLWATESALFKIIDIDGDMVTVLDDYNGECVERVLPIDFITEFFQYVGKSLENTVFDLDIEQYKNYHCLYFYLKNNA